VMDRPALAGHADASLSLSAEGASWSELLASLDGEARVKAVGASIDGVSPSEAIRAAAGGQSGSILNDSGSRAALDQITVRLAISDGVAVARELSAESSRARATATGRVLLTDGGLDLKGTAALRAGLERDVPFVLTGTWTRPLLLPDPAGAMAGEQNRIAPASAAGAIPEPQRF